MDVDLEYEEYEMYVYLDFGDLLDREYFNKQNMFFKVVRLDQEQPLVQLDDKLYIGSCQNCLGTNVFFEENDAVEKNNIFEKETPINLTYLTKQIKEIKLKRLEKKLITGHDEVKKDTYIAPKSNSSSENIDDSIEDEQVSVSKENEFMIEEQLESSSDKDEKIIYEEEKIKPKCTESERMKKLDDFTKRKIAELNIDAEKYNKLVALAKVPMKFEVPQEKVDIPQNLVINYFYRWLSRKYLQVPFDKIVKKEKVLSVENVEQVSVESLDNIDENTPLSIRHCLILREIKKLENSSQQTVKYGLSALEYSEVLKLVSKDIEKKLKSV